MDGLAGRACGGAKTTKMIETRTGLRIRAAGIVQGVGFRPFIYSLAQKYSLTGWVRNSSAGVEIEIFGNSESLDALFSDIRTNPPPLARVLSLTGEQIPYQFFADFQIVSSHSSAGDFLPISPDISTCPDCLKELMDSTDRRYRYPFINCTNCGPRFTIVKDIPYDRPLTTMSGFPLCPDCSKEYHDPANRRFHAQPIACPKCGPQVSFVINQQVLEVGENAIQTARRWLKDGKIVAVKGLGGYLLACDASNPAAVQTLRTRKKRSDKPFALMAFDLASIEKQCWVSPAEAALLDSTAHPVVILNKKSTSSIADECAPHQQTLGLMLPYTPLHTLLLEPEAGFPEVLVMTSGNLSEEPIAYDDDDAMQRLSGLADAFLTHNRPIHMRMDDSVAVVSANSLSIIRRARGYAPSPLILPYEIHPTLAVGAEIKNTFCLTRKNQAYISHHIGDLENLETLTSFETGIAHYQRLFRIQPEVIACDMHPNYLSTLYAKERAKREGIPLVAVQHHHAHLAACLADNSIQYTEPVIGICFDGTGYGTDGAIWGGEFLVGSYQQYRRAYHLEYTPQPGGDLAALRPSRMALSWLHTLQLGWDMDLPPVMDLCYEERTIIASQIQHNINAPLTSSMGRLFDAISALIGVRQSVTYEGQAAIELEALADPEESHFYNFEILADAISIQAMVEEILQDFRSAVSLSIISAKFHNTLAQICLEICQRIQSQEGISTAALSGGVWQNRYLFARTVYNLETNGFTVLRHHQTPTNDGCIALGQAMVAAQAYS